MCGSNWSPRDAFMYVYVNLVNLETIVTWSHIFKDQNDCILLYKRNKFHNYESDRWKFNSYCDVLELYWKGNLVKGKKRGNINDERILWKRRIAWWRIQFSRLSHTTWWMGVCERIQRRKECMCMRVWNLDIMNRGECHSLPSLLLE